MNKDLRQSVAQALEQGISREEVRTLLTQAGWSEAEREEALGLFVDTPHHLAIPKRAPVTLAKESYLYFMQVAFYTLTAVAFLILWFQYINLWIPGVSPEDTANFRYSENGIRELIRTGLSILIVSLPIFLGVSWLIGKHEAKSLDAPQNALKHAFLYLGAMVASMTAAITLMVTVFQGLSGEATMRFWLKIIAIFLVCAVTAWLAWRELRTERVRRAQLSNPAHKT